ncbi:hypothetical protein GCM10007890_31750 [Methylobacterium tardum]|uniref:Uncharacterized protein n=1 Tax=Methylobacterium tardum TaxID=374432 RepID=A0AA37TJF2_9HYPH|nr:hypothetical protein GCM10007890_31750 [Methylobacterium tardum]
MLHGVVPALAGYEITDPDEAHGIVRVGHAEVLDRIPDGLWRAHHRDAQSDDDPEDGAAAEAGERPGAGLR